ncbi:MAG: type 1 glutamine amidotransferase [Pseudooceanicola sp.]|nr:type 1 glutamine amidotransferase [Pseudooceanicola sp.]
MKIGILQTGHAPDELLGEFGDYDRIFQQMLGAGDFDFASYAVVDGQFPAGADDCDGWLITGSRHGAYEDHAWIPPLEALIREIHAKGLPLIGVCFGHQIIAQALGGKVEKFKGGWSVGPTEYDMGGKTVTLNAWHQDQVVQRPEGARVLASSAFCENAILAYGDTIWTVQPHPEYGNDFIGGLIRTRGKGVVPDAQLAAATANLNVPVDNDEFARAMADFFRKARA